MVKSILNLTEEFQFSVETIEFYSAPWSHEI